MNAGRESNQNRSNCLGGSYRLHYMIPYQMNEAVVFRSTLRGEGGDFSSSNAIDVPDFYSAMVSPVWEHLPLLLLAKIPPQNLTDFGAQ